MNNRIAYDPYKAENAKLTDTKGRYVYLVATLIGGVMEHPDFYYENYQIIKADSEYEARKKYDQINNCSYYYGSVIKRLN